MNYKTVLGLRFGIAFAVIAILLIVTGWRNTISFSMPVAVLCSLGAPATRRTKALFLLGWIVYMGGICWVVKDTYGEMRLHAVKKRL